MNGAPVLEDLQGILQGERVRLEPLGAGHADGLLAAARDGGVFTWLFGDLAQRHVFHGWLESSLEAARARREVPFAVIDATADRAVGSTRYLEIRLEHRRVEIGWTWLAGSTWGTGLNVEAKLLLLGRAFSAGCRRVEFKTHAENARSRGALEALGARFEGVLRRHMLLPDGSSRDSAYYSVIEEEWPELRERQAARLEGMRS